MELTSNHSTYNLANLAHIIDTDVNAIEGELKALKSWLYSWLYLDVFGADDDELAAEVDIGLMDNIAVKGVNHISVSVEITRERRLLILVFELKYKDETFTSATLTARIAPETTIIFDDNIESPFPAISIKEGA